MEETCKSGNTVCMPPLWPRCHCTVRSIICDGASIILVIFREFGASTGPEYPSVFFHILQIMLTKFTCLSYVKISTRYTCKPSQMSNAGNISENCTSFRKEKGWGLPTNWGPTYWLAAEKDEGKLGVSDVSIGANALALNLPQSGAARLKKPSTVCSISWTRTIHYPKPSMNQWRYTISTSGKYTHKLENISGTLIIHTKTAFVGFLTAIQSVNALFTDFLVGSPDQLPHLEYLRTYELSQDLI